MLAWAAALLAHHPGVQAAAAAEAATVLGTRPVRPDDAGSLPLIESILLETMRLLPPAYIVGRCAAADAAIAGVTVSAGTTLLVSPYLLHRDPALWEAPTQFWPQRWLPLLEGGGGGAASRPAAPGGLRSAAVLAGLGPNGAFLPFGAGPRVCIGAGFAMLEGVLVLASLLRSWELLPPAAGAPFPAAAPRITLRPAAVPLRLRPRSGA